MRALANSAKVRAGLRLGLFVHSDFRPAAGSLGRARRRTWGRALLYYLPGSSPMPAMAHRLHSPWPLLVNRVQGHGSVTTCVFSGCVGRVVAHSASPSTSPSPMKHAPRSRRPRSAACTASSVGTRSGTKVAWRPWPGPNIGATSSLLARVAVVVVAGGASRTRASGPRATSRASSTRSADVPRAPCGTVIVWRLHGVEHEENGRPERASRSQMTDYASERRRDSGAPRPASSGSGSGPGAGPGGACSGAPPQSPS